MKDRYVVDTNVLIAASAADPITPADIDATPREPAYREQVWNWLSEFKGSDSKLVLDYKGGIFEEYNRKLGFNDFGPQVVMNKWDKGNINQVDVTYDDDEHGELDEPLKTVIHDRADRKMVAASMEAKRIHGQSCVAFAGDTDWHEWEDFLNQINFELEPVIEEWSREKYREKQG